MLRARRAVGSLDRACAVPVGIERARAAGQRADDLFVRAGGARSADLADVLVALFPIPAWLALLQLGRQVVQAVKPRAGS
eukprot:2007354-Rhodomonas_salina.2